MFRVYFNSNPAMCELSGNFIDVSSGELAIQYAEKFVGGSYKKL